MAGGKSSPETEKGINIDFGFLDEVKVGDWPGPLRWLKVFLIKLCSYLLVKLLGEPPEPKFSREEEKRIRQAVKEQIDSSDPWIVVEGVSLPKMGRIFRLKKDAGPRYGIIKPGFLLFVIGTMIAKEWLANPERIEVDVLPLDSEGKVAQKRPMGVLAKDIEPIENEKDLIANWSKMPKKQDPLFDGEAVELARDVPRVEQTQQGTLLLDFRKGLKGVIDRPDFQQGATADDINARYQREYEIGVEICLTLYSGGKKDFLKRTYFRIPLARTEETYLVYVPAYRSYVDRPYFKFARSELKRRTFDKKALDRVVMDKKTRKKIISLICGKEEVLEKWGLKSAFQKGMGKTFIAYGPPGSGKTMTGEALSEYLEKPLYFATLSDFGSTIKSFEEGLEQIIERTERWGAVTIIDEAELILESRNASGFDSSMRVAAVLRNLEKLQKGILWLTTNRPVVIDFAIESRIRAQIYFPPFTVEKRKEVWEITLPKDTPIVPEISSRLDELAKINLNGREIRNVILNAADQSSSEGLKYIPLEYLFAWAKDIIENRDTLKKAARSDGRTDGEIGFKTGK